MAGISWDDHKQSGEPLKRTGTWAVVAGLVAIAVPASAAPIVWVEPTSVESADPIDLIVGVQPDRLTDVEATVWRLGGEVTHRLDLIDSLAVTVPAELVEELASASGVLRVTEDVELSSSSADDDDDSDSDDDDSSDDDSSDDDSSDDDSSDDDSSDDDSSDDADEGAARTASAPATATVPPTSVRASAVALGVDALWDAGIDGSGIDVALIDSGVASSRSLAGRVVVGPDLSFEAEDSRVRHTDTFGHGTHLAGIIAGSDTSSGFTGVAPASRIVSVKVADDDGLTDVSQVIAAIDWVVEHRSANGMNIRVLNLAFGTNGNQPHALDPLAFAAEQAWKHGIVVVVAAGNEGEELGYLNNPASDPHLLAVGAADIAGTATTTDDSIPTWSSRGDGKRNPDVVAPGRSVLSLNVEGSDADRRASAEARVGDLIKGSGTSQASAFVSGVVALMLDADPSLTPDQIKNALTATAADVPGATARAAGHGLIQVDDAAKAARKANKKPAKKAKWSEGDGSLDASRGDARISRDGEVLQGENTVFGEFDAGEWSASGSTWSGSTWSGSTWSAGSWLGSTWSGSTWSGSTWSGSTWSGSTWSGSTWSGSTWSGHTWSTVGWR